MLNEKQVDHFNTKGFLIVEDLLDEATLEVVRLEYFQRMDHLYHAWQAQTCK